MKRSPRIQRLLVAVMALTVFGATTVAGPVPVASGTAALGAATPRLVLIVMENKEYTAIVNSPAAPYINGTLIPASRVFTQYYATDHPSLPDYLAMTSATASGCVVDSCPPGFDAGANLFHQLDQAGISWKAYQGGMPSNCYPANAGTYLVRHNPPVYYSNLAHGSCAANDVPLTEFAGDLASGALPAFSFVTPDMYQDMHTDQRKAPCRLSTAIKSQMCQGDRWLKSFLPSLLALNKDADLGNDVTVVMTFDEGSTGEGGGGRVLTLETGPNVTPGQDATMYGHLSLLNAVENWFGVAKLRPPILPV